MVKIKVVLVACCLVTLLAMMMLLSAPWAQADETTSTSPTKEQTPADKYADRRDPFRSLLEPLPPVPIVLIIPEIGEGDIPPLQNLENVNQLKVIGIMQGQLGDYGIVDAPDGKMYILAIGTRVGKFGGTVTSISDNVITITEAKQYKVGEEIQTKEEVTELRLNPLEQEKK